MNKRQKKKDEKKYTERFNLIFLDHKYLFHCRQNGKTFKFKFAIKVCEEKSYKNFKIIKKQLSK